jgi:hypothetical protein
MTRSYQIVDRADRHTALDPVKLTVRLAEDGQCVLPCWNSSSMAKLSSTI